MKEIDYWLGFSVFPGVGPVSFQLLLDTFHTAENAWKAPEGALKALLKEKKTQDFIVFRQTFDFEKYKKRLEKTRVNVITREDKEYPLLLKQIKNPPFVLYVKGDPVILGSGATPGSKRDSGQARMTMGIVGTRKITQYGREVTEMFTKSLVQVGFTIVSGLAMGVDTVAHQTTIDHGGKTIAVLGCGVDCCYPRENEALYDEIIKSGGAIISEVPLGMFPTVGTFPARNRIVAGMSDAVLVTQGSEDSGSLITAEFGRKYDRKVFAVPGPIMSDVSKGPYILIEKGAKLVTKPQDILKELQMGNDELQSKRKKIVGDTAEEELIIDLLQNEPMNFDEIVRKTKIDSAKIGTIISLMEIKGFVKIVHNTVIVVSN